MSQTGVIVIVCCVIYLYVGVCLLWAFYHQAKYWDERRNKGRKENDERGN